jgi:alanyl-tRNA synthetase
VETKRLYFEDPYRTEFFAQVLERTTHEGRHALVLDQTCFYPESGGQPSDKGKIDGIDVLQVFERNGLILHLVEREIVSEKIKGLVDWKTRFDHMQQHAGQHVLSQCFHQLFKAKTLSFHLGEQASTIEVDMRNLAQGQAARAEELANALIFEDREIKTYFVSQEEIEGVPLRKPPQKRGLIRVVEISEFDFTACGGTHPRRTGEIGPVKILKWDRIRDNVRFEFVCGKRAVADYVLKHSILRELAVRFTVGESDVPGLVEKLSNELKDQKKLMKRAQEKLSRFEAQEIAQKVEGRIIREVFTERSVEEAKNLALNIIKDGDFIVLFGVILEDRGHLILASSETTGFDTRDLIPIVSPLVNGKGGGSQALVEIFAPEISKIGMALDSAFEHVKTKLKNLQSKNGVRHE